MVDNPSYLPIRDFTIVCSLLEQEYLRPDPACPPLGNKLDPLDELIFILLTIMTEYGAKKVFDQIKGKYSSWQNLLDSSKEEFYFYLRPLGLVNQRGKKIIAILKEVKRRLGVVNLDVLRNLSDDEIENFLTTLPGVGIKTARCVMMYSLGCKVFPVDTHVYRLSKRLGLLRPDVSWQKSHDILQTIVPDEYRYSLHVNLVRHGREICKAKSPKCQDCILRKICTNPKQGELVMISPDDLERKIGELLDDFYRRRMAKINELRLKDALRRKNPYLFRAVGVQKASEIVEQLLTAYMSSSDEGIFGDAFFEPLAKFASGGIVAPSEGVDVVRETATEYIAIAVKSGTSVFNADSRKRQVQNFESLEARLKKLHKHFDPVIGYAYGRKKPKTQTKIRELAGQAFWSEVTGDPDFYLKIIRLMKDKPQEHLTAYRNAWDAAVNRFTKAFIDEFCNSDGTIDWNKLTKFNSGMSS
jgi:endonuclease III